jgi:aconitate hydratase
MSKLPWLKSMQRLKGCGMTICRATFLTSCRADLSTVVPSISGPKRPQDRISLSELQKSAFGKLVSTTLEYKTQKGESCKAGSTRVKNGDVVIASITSCTNTSNPSVMIGAALLAKKAVAKGLKSKPWVKTTLAPGSKVVTDYYDRADLTKYMEALGFNLVGYGCVTCIGNSGPLPIEISKAVNEADLAVTAVLSGNRNFEGRISPDVKMNYLASPPLVVAYAIAGTMDHDFETDSLGKDTSGNDVLPQGHLAITQEIQAVIDSSISSEMFTKDYATVFEGDAPLEVPCYPNGQGL